MSVRFIHQGVTRLWFLPAVAIASAPTRSEINFGIDLTPEVKTVGGFALENQVREFSPVGAGFVETRPGIDKVSAACTLTMYDRTPSSTIRSTWMIRGATGVVLIAPYGDAVGRRCETWPVRIATVGDTWADGPSLYRVVFAVTTTPFLSAHMPA